MTVLGLFPPMIYNGDVHIDGGYVNNIPVDVMVEQGHCGTIIAVDVEDKDM
jgi:lysophospholipid hydrolase